jgi:hypothetical protein
VNQVQDPSFRAEAKVIKGGNRLLKITAHVVCRDPSGQVRFEKDAEVMIPIPAGSDVPLFQCEEVRAVVLPKDLTFHED